METICIFDIETNGLGGESTDVHCIVIYSIEEDIYYEYGPDSIEEGLSKLSSFDTIVGHNIIGFDIPELEKICGWRKHKGQSVYDTLVVSRLVYPDRAQRDSTAKSIDRSMYGRHSLESWGQRLGFQKGDFSDFGEFTTEMMAYCRRDVKLNLSLYNKLLEADFSVDSIDLEHKIHSICLNQTKDGFPFDVKKAIELYSILADRREVLHKTLKEVFGSWEVVKREFIPKVNNKSQGYIKGVPVVTHKRVDFNPNSRAHIAKRLGDIHGWKPKETTPTGEPKIDESILSKLPYPEAQLMAESFRVNKLIGQISEGQHGWLKYEKGGRIHGSVNTMGSVSSRCSHSHPNIGQVPSVKSPFGKECRELFFAPEGYSLLGCDVSSLELRVVSHYLSPFDNGKYGETVVNGDIHTVNQKTTGLATRDQAKTFIYGLLYGAGDAKLGEIVGKDRKEGNRLKKLFFKKVPAFKKLREKVFEKANERGFLFGLDGRKVPVRSVHSSLNLLCQSAGAIICKKWVVEFHKMMEEAEIKDYKQVAFIHDEIQVLVKRGQEDIVGKITVDAITRAGNLLGVTVPLTGEYVYGRNWAETH